MTANARQLYEVGQLNVHLFDKKEVLPDFAKL